MKPAGVPKKRRAASTLFKDHYQTAFDLTDAAFLLLDADLTILDVDDHRSRLLGRERKECLGAKFHDLFPPAMRGRILLLRQALHQLTPVKFDAEVVIDATKIVVNISASKINTRGEKRILVCLRCVDITDFKAAEESLADLSGQLIRAREEERARIARDLHDDLNQRMALVSVELEQLGQSPPQSTEELRERLNHVIEQTLEISREIHRMSHDLHPSRLVHLGLVAAVEGLCDDLHHSHGLKTELIDEDVPADLPKEISLCLYRIVQECLNNLIRHSGVREAKVELRGTGKEILLRVSDSGRGFDIESPTIRSGLGFVSMRERLRLVGGTVTIGSRPSAGTNIDARIPLEGTDMDFAGRSFGNKTRAAGG